MAETAKPGPTSSSLWVRSPTSDLGLTSLRAHAYVQPSIAEGFGLAVVEAFAFGLPIVHTDVAALEEVTAGAAVSVPLAGDGLPARLAEAIDAVSTVGSRSVSAPRRATARARSTGGTPPRRSGNCTPTCDRPTRGPAVGG